MPVGGSPIQKHVYAYWVQEYDWPLSGECYLCRGRAMEGMIGFFMFWFALCYLLHALAQKFHLITDNFSISLKPDREGENRSTKI